ncbi:uncharacterized protein [Clytia hemisphaerica]
MENVIRKLIQEEMNKDSLQASENSQSSSQSSTSQNSSQGTSQDSSQGTSQDSSRTKKKHKTEGRLTNLLNKIRRQSANDTDEEVKTKGIQIKWKRFFPDLLQDKIVRADSGGGLRLIEVPYKVPYLFKDLLHAATLKYFNKNSLNSFGEAPHQCILLMEMADGDVIDSEEDLWQFIRVNGLVISKTTFIFHTKINSDVLFDTTCVVCQQSDYMTPFGTCMFCEQGYQLPNILIGPALPANPTEQPALPANSDRPALPDNSAVQLALPANPARPALPANPAEQPALPANSDRPALPDNSAVQPVLPDNPAVQPVLPDNPPVQPVLPDNPPVQPVLPDNPPVQPVLPGDSVEPLVSLRAEINRGRVLDDMMRLFRHTLIGEDTEITFAYINYRGEVEPGEGIGVTRDVYTSFWIELADGFCIGENMRVPSVRHDFFEDHWSIVGKILVKGYRDTKYFPTYLATAFINYCLFNNVSRQCMFQSFDQYLSESDRETIKLALSPNAEDEFFSSDDFLDFLDIFKCRSRVNKSNVNRIIFEIAQQELIQRPHIMASAFSRRFAILKHLQEFSSPENVEAMIYEKTRPTSKKLIALLIYNCKDDVDREIIGFLKRFLKGLDTTQIKKFVKFLSGADIILFEKIEVSLVDQGSDFARRPISHTCGPLLEIANSYNNFMELRSDFTQVLQPSDWPMDIV